MGNNRKQLARCVRFVRNSRLRSCAIRFVFPPRQKPPVLDYFYRAVPVFRSKVDDIIREYGDAEVSLLLH